MPKKRLAIFCGSSTGHHPAYSASTRELARELYQRGIGAVFGGGHVGLMGLLADELMGLGGEVIGVIPRKLMEREIGHQGLTKLHVVETMHERKALMASLSHGFVALPGGIGTLEEIIEVFTWQQIGYHEKPCGFLNTQGYYDRLFQFIDHTVAEGFLSSTQRDRLMVSDEPAELIQRMLQQTGH